MREIFARGERTREKGSERRGEGKGREGKGVLHFGIFLRIHYGGDGDAKVGDRAPEICRRSQLVETRMFRSWIGSGGAV